MLLASVELSIHSGQFQRARDLMTAAGRTMSVWAFPLAASNAYLAAATDDATVDPQPRPRGPKRRSCSPACSTTCDASTCGWPHDGPRPLNTACKDGQPYAATERPKAS